MEQSDASKRAHEKSAEFVEAITELKRMKAWAVFREEIERRIAGYTLSVMKPVDDQGGAFFAERAKGSALALQGLLVPFDSKLPEMESLDERAAE